MESEPRQCEYENAGIYNNMAWLSEVQMVKHEDQ
jgi:hypothetical protein